MDTPPEEARSRSFATPPRRRRRFSIWTVLAPVAVLVLWVSFFSALGGSCIFKECADAKESSETKAETKSEAKSDSSSGSSGNGSSNGSAKQDSDSSKSSSKPDKKSA